MRYFLLLAVLSCAYDDDDDDDDDDGGAPGWFGDDTGEGDADTDADGDGDSDSDADSDSDPDDPPPRDEDGDGYEVSDGDCDDRDPYVNPGERESCNEIDDNCDGEVDERVIKTYYADADGDGFGDPGASIESCEAPAGFVTNANDCDDSDAAIYPGNSETCDGRDNDCDGTIDEAVGSVFYADADGDGYGDPSSVVSSCTRPRGYVPDDTDCDDANADSYPGNAEVCDEFDNDCDGEVDEDVTTTYYADADEDGYGDAAAAYAGCSAPVGYVLSADDCDDYQASAYPGAAEICDELDNDCDGEINNGFADGHENDDSLALAWDAGEIDGSSDFTGLTLHADGDEDWIRWEADDSWYDNVVVEVSVTLPATGTYVLELVDEDGAVMDADVGSGSLYIRYEGDVTDADEDVWAVRIRAKTWDADVCDDGYGVLIES